MSARPLGAGEGWAAESTGVSAGSVLPALPGWLADGCFFCGDFAGAEKLESATGGVDSGFSVGAVASDPGVGALGVATSGWRVGVGDGCAGGFFSSAGAFAGLSGVGAPGGAESGEGDWFVAAVLAGRLAAGADLAEFFSPDFSGVSGAASGPGGVVAVALAAGAAVAGFAFAAPVPGDVAGVSADGGLPAGLSAALEVAEAAASAAPEESLAREEPGEPGLAGFFPEEGAWDFAVGADAEAVAAPAGDGDSAADEFPSGASPADRADGGGAGLTTLGFDFGEDALADLSSVPPAGDFSEAAGSGSLPLAVFAEEAGASCGDRSGLPELDEAAPAAGFCLGGKF